MKTVFTPLPLGAAEITDKLCKNAFEREAEYLLSLEGERLLCGFYENAGLPAPRPRYGGWESGLLGGHTLGHYLSALAQAQANGGVPEGLRTKLKERIAFLVTELARCQTHGKGGFLWGATVLGDDPESQFDCVEQGKTDIEKEAWVPWYTMHKLLSGLLACARLAESKEAETVARRLGEWAARRALGWDARTRKRVLAVEYGGMNDCLYDLYALTGEEKFAEAAHVFDEETLFDRILSGDANVLKGLHTNTTIPKVTGAVNRFLTLDGKEIGGKRVDGVRYLRVGEEFFRIVTERHTYATGGNSENEHFGADLVLDKKRTNCNCESCNVYNMLKLARALFAATGKMCYADYYDNAFTNAVLPSQNPATGMTTYFQPMGSGYFKVFSTPYSTFWCCTGSGMESFTKLSDGMFYTDGNALFVERYLSSKVSFSGAELTIDCDFPFSDRAVIKILRAEKPLPLAFRVPDWADGAPELFKNGRHAFSLPVKDHLRILASEGDEIEVKIPVSVSLKGLPDGKDAFAFFYGGTLLAARFGKAGGKEKTTGVDVRIPARRCGSEKVYFENLEEVFSDPSAYLVREGEDFRLRGADRELVFRPYNRIYNERYAIYLRLCEKQKNPETCAKG